MTAAATPLTPAERQLLAHGGALRQRLWGVRANTSRARCALAPLPWKDLERVRDAAQQLINAREPDEIIYRGHDMPYLTRWHLERRAAGGNIYLHRVESDDPHDLHCHPWESISAMLAGTLREEWRAAGDAAGSYIHTLQAGSVVVRSARLAHRLVRADATHAPITLFVTAPKSREWGFWPEGPAGTRFVPWRAYHQRSAAA